MTGLVTSTRMYNAAPAVEGAWRALFQRLFADCALDVQFIEHGYPQPIDTLWSDPRLFSAFMCGWPFARTHGRMQPIAVPVPAPSRYEGLPRYCSEFLVRGESGWASVEATFGHRIGWMARDSQSGYNAPRALLAQHVTPDRPRLYRESVGPLVTPMRALDALRAAEVDVVALDSFFLDLLRHHAPGKLAGLDTIATTPWTPMPLLVAAPAVSDTTVERLRDRLLSVHEAPGYASLLADVLVARFVRPDVPGYAVFEAIASCAIAHGYAEIT